VDAMSRSSQKAMFEGDLLIQADILVSSTLMIRNAGLT
jgi:hypothetical protein